MHFYKQVIGFLIFVIVANQLNLQNKGFTKPQFFCECCQQMLI